jgi:hypothetical protein
MSNDELTKAFDEIQGARTRFQLDAFSIGAKHTAEFQYAQTVLEMQIKYDAIRMAEAKRHQISAEIAQKQLELEQQDRAMLGARREYDHLHKRWESFPRKFTREEIESAAPEEYRTMIQTQSVQDLLEHGAISVGNQDALRMCGVECKIIDGAPVFEVLANPGNNVRMLEGNK